MRIRKEVLSNGKKIINIKWSWSARQIPHWAVYLKNSCYLELARIFNCGILVSYSS